MDTPTKAGRFCLILGNNFDDIEAIAVIDLLRRAGVAIDLYGIGCNRIRSASGLEYPVDRGFLAQGDLKPSDYDGILLPGGPGVADLLFCTELIRAIRDFHAEGKLIYAICGAPLLLDKAGILDGKRFTCLPAVAPRIKSGSYSEAAVMQDGNIVTSQALGTSIEGALALIGTIISPEKQEEIRRYYHIRTIT